MKNPLVSTIVTTKNNEATLDACLRSIKEQSYDPIELLVVDNYSEDSTPKIAKKYTKLLFSKGPERSAQRNYGVKKSRGKYILIIDSDMELTLNVVKACVDKIVSKDNIKAVIIPEESFGIGFWAQCKRLERSFYVGVPWIEAARFFDSSTYKKVGGYDESMISGEDWDISKRFEKISSIGHIDEFIRHDEGRMRLITDLKKKYYYAKNAQLYLNKNKVSSKLAASNGPIQRYSLYFSNPRKLFKNPIYGFGMLFLKTCEFSIGGIGYKVTDGSVSCE